MVKLLLVCFAVCMGATSGTVTLGTCSGKGVKENLIKYNEATYSLCGISEDSYNELLKLVGNQVIERIELVFQTYVAATKTIKATLKIYLKNSPKPREANVDFTEKEDSTIFTGLASIVSSTTGEVINTGCANGNVFTEICIRIGGKAGLQFSTHWTLGSQGVCASGCVKSTVKWHKIR